MMILEGNKEGCGILIEQCSSRTQIIEEYNDLTKEKDYYISGLYSEADVKLKNPRIYPKHILEREVNKFKKLIKDGRSWGELEHPNHLMIDTNRISHIITELEWEGNVLNGKAKIVVDTPQGKILKGLARSGKPGVSSRGGGSVKNQYVQENFSLLTWDAVIFPSANSVMDLIQEQEDLLLQGGANEQSLDVLITDIKKNNIDRREFDKLIVERFKKIFH